MPRPLSREPQAGLSGETPQNGIWKEKNSRPDPDSRNTPAMECGREQATNPSIDGGPIAMAVGALWP
ncbi:hypothetical protein PHISP_00688 [Aspergillus sp. HF37]|nr:hypothetical protein PHISP_00688 [Aspergillus sp. HF37]